jgi:hypothetical protein
VRCPSAEKRGAHGTIPKRQGVLRRVVPAVASGYPLGNGGPGIHGTYESHRTPVAFALREARAPRRFPGSPGYLRRSYRDNWSPLPPPAPVCLQTAERAASASRVIMPRRRPQPKRAAPARRRLDRGARLNVLDFFPRYPASLVLGPMTVVLDSPRAHTRSVVAWQGAVYATRYPSSHHPQPCGAWRTLSFGRQPNRHRRGSAR